VHVASSRNMKNELSTVRMAEVVAGE
jgi:hypothetical protein